MGAPRWATWASRMLSERSLSIADEVAAVAARLGTTPTAVALAWAAAQPAITSVIIGPRTQEQLEQNLAGTGLRLPDDDIAHLTQVSQPANGPVTGSALS